MILPLLYMHPSYSISLTVYLYLSLSAFPLFFSLKTFPLLSFSLSDSLYLSTLSLNESLLYLFLRVFFLDLPTPGRQSYAYCL